MPENSLTSAARRERVSRTTESALEDAAREGTKRLNADVPESLYRRIRMQAAAEDRSIKDLIVEAMENYLGGRVNV